MATSTPHGPRADDAIPSSAPSLRILHISDTHGFHRSIEELYGPLPPADVLVHTGDFSNHGTDDEIADLDAWFGSLRPRYRHIVAIPGNHDWRDALQKVQSGALPAASLLDPAHFKSKFSNATLLFHETIEISPHASTAPADGAKETSSSAVMRIHGASWDPWHDSANPEGPATAASKAGKSLVWEAHRSFHHRDGAEPVASHHYNAIVTAGRIDVLLTHGPPLGIFDDVEMSGKSWGSSRELRRAIESAKPRAHLFGHMHEQRGVYARNRRGDAAGCPFAGGVEYERVPGEGTPPVTIDPQWMDPLTKAVYPCELVCCNAMLNHSSLDGKCKHLAGGPRMIVATFGGDDEAMGTAPAEGGATRTTTAEKRWYFQAEPPMPRMPSFKN